jgi:hypothetical protein
MQVRVAPNTMEWLPARQSLQMLVAVPLLAEALKQRRLKRALAWYLARPLERRLGRRPRAERLAVKAEGSGRSTIRAIETPTWFHPSGGSVRSLGASSPSPAMGALGPLFPKLARRRTTGRVDKDSHHRRLSPGTAAPAGYGGGGRMRWRSAALATGKESTRPEDSARRG